MPLSVQNKKLGKVFCRMASCYEKQGMFDEALQMYGKASTEDNNRTTRNAIRECERKKEKWDEAAHLHEEPDFEALCPGAGKDVLRRKKRAWLEWRRVKNQASKSCFAALRGGLRPHHTTKAQRRRRSTAWPGSCC